MSRALLEVDDLSRAELHAVLALAREPDLARTLDGQGTALVFEKPSTRTRNSMEMAVVQLGGHPITIAAEEVGIDTRESAEDVARTLACYHAVIAARVFAHSTVERMATAVDVPVINMLSDEAHPLQALADILTIADAFGDLGGQTVAFVGDANNVCRSLAIAAGMCDIAVNIASPAGYGLSDGDLDRIRAAGVDPLLTDNPAEAVAGADVVYTDVWTSMGQEAESAARLDAFAGFTVTADLLAGADEKAIFLHCLPAHRGEEVSAAVMESEQSFVFAQAENRMHAARGLLAWLADAE